MVPTYDERDSIGSVIARLHASSPHAHVLVADDASPDGTGELVAALATGDDRIHLLRRSGKQGLGAAYVAAMRWGLERGYDVLVEMDADGSHPPERVGDLVAALADADVVIGSRWVPGGAVVDWPWHRRALSRGGNGYVRAVLGIGVRDATAGFRAYRADVLRGIRLDDVDSRGYCFQIDMTLRALDAGARIVELPIEFRERELGRSKMTRAIVGEAILKVTRWAIGRRLLGRRRA
jgi:dolichol-phosphate mannosyltransferase